MSDLGKLVKLLIKESIDFSQITNKVSNSITVSFKNVSVDFRKSGQVISINR
jgi:hypothetical protein